ncbi:hypothetical protein F511_20193 [Dorcoceras hygrometricum]|uniref:Uncharacterized protein n=1 Tax=Dorcoceras hygrometricum TaxID=472368 RepID=A0A2Z7A1W1_9LAMI|nr:hypothetical protein F511_20193 [Dorcoceras hygrometricum]
MDNSGHGVCEHMGATHSSQHTAPDETHSSTRCCPTHKVWELPTPLIVANKSSRKMRYGSYPLILNRHPDPTDNLRYKADFPFGSESHNRYNSTPGQIPTNSNDVAQSPLSHLDTSPTTQISIANATGI